SVFCFLFPRALVSFPTRRSSDLHLRMNRLVALKMIPRLESADSEEMLRFRIEGEVLARLQHPHVVQIFDVGALDGRPYLALEYRSEEHTSQLHSLTNLACRLLLH